MTELFDDAEAKKFFEAMISLENTDECRDFLMDLCTIKELEAMVQRFHVARMLASGSLYAEIVRETGASTATISRVNRALSYGREGYHAIIGRCDTNA
ncbi:MAG: YerC/YecD family TrpR-related protein [Clostridia bacterium]